MVDLSTKANACEWVAMRGHQDFGEMWVQLRPLCFNEHGWPAGVSHVGHFDSLSEPPLSDEIRENLIIAYVYLAASFFCLDHLYDNESQDKFEILASSVLIPKALERIGVALSLEGQPPTLGSAEAATLFQRFATAMLLEDEVRAQPHLRAPKVERSHVVGRSWLVIFTYRLIQQLKRQPVDPEAQTLLEEAIYLLQLGDDWGDWRKDYRSGNLTSFIRECIESIGRLPLDEDELERFVYLSGQYERRGRFVASGLKDIERRLAAKYDQGAKSILGMVRQCRELSEAVVENFDRVKAGLPPRPLPAPLH